MVLGGRPVNILPLPSPLTLRARPALAGLPDLPAAAVPSAAELEDSEAGETLYRLSVELYQQPVPGHRIVPSRIGTVLLGKRT